MLYSWHKTKDVVDVVLGGNGSTMRIERFFEVVGIKSIGLFQGKAILLNFKTVL